MMFKRKLPLIFLAVVLLQSSAFAEDENYLQMGEAIEITGKTCLLSVCGRGAVETCNLPGRIGIHIFHPQRVDRLEVPQSFNGEVIGACFDALFDFVVLSTKSPFGLYVMDLETESVSSVVDSLEQHHAIEILGVKDRDTIMFATNGEVHLSTKEAVVPIASYKQRYGVGFLAGSISNQLAAVFPSKASCGAVYILDLVLFNDEPYKTLEGFQYFGPCAGFAAKADIDSASGGVAAFVSYFGSESCPQSDAILVWTGSGELLDISHLPNSRNCLDVAISPNSVSALFGTLDDNKLFSKLTVHSWNISLSEGLVKMPTIEIPLPFAVENALFESVEDLIIASSNVKKQLVRFRRKIGPSKK